jgi:hypothetical protein
MAVSDIATALEFGRLFKRGKWTNNPNDANYFQHWSGLPLQPGETVREVYPVVREGSPRLYENVRVTDQNVYIDTPKLPPAFGHFFVKPGKRIHGDCKGRRQSERDNDHGARAFEASTRQKLLNLLEHLDNPPATRPVTYPFTTLSQWSNGRQGRQSTVAFDLAGT